MVGNDPDRVTRRRLLRGAGAAGLTALAGCSGADDGPDPERTTEAPETNAPPETRTTARTTETDRADVLAVGLAGAPDGYEPNALSVGRGRHLLGHVYEALYTYDETTTLVPRLAATRPEISDDGTTYRVELASGPRFHTGDPVTAADVERSFEWLLDESEGTRPVPVVESIQSGDGTVTFSLSEPYAPFVHVLAARGVVPGGSRPTTTTAGEMPPGSGPFRLASAGGGTVRLERWTDYWGSLRPKLPGATLTPVSEPTLRFNNLESGTNDVVEETHPSIWKQIESTERARLVGTPGLRYVYLGFNCREGPMADPILREAVDYCVSFDDAVADFVAPTGTRQYSPLPISVAEEWGMPNAEWADIAHERNVERAIDRFDGSDTVPDDWEPRIIVPDTETYERLAIAVANGLSDAGYEARIQRLEVDSFAAAHVSGDVEIYDLFLSEWTGLPDPDAFTYPLFAPEAEGSTNGTFYRNDTVTQKLAGARRTTEREARAERYREAITTILEDRVHLPIYARNRGFGVREYVRDFAAHPVTGFTLVSDHNNVWVEK